MTFELVFSAWHIWVTWWTSSMRPWPKEYGIASFNAPWVVWANGSETRGILARAPSFFGGADARLVDVAPPVRLVGTLGLELSHLPQI